MKNLIIATLTLMFATISNANQLKCRYFNETLTAEWPAKFKLNNVKIISDEEPLEPLYTNAHEIGYKAPRADAIIFSIDMDGYGSERHFYLPKTRVLGNFTATVLTVEDGVSPQRFTAKCSSTK